MTKAEELALADAGKGTLGKAAANEPVFILRGQDRLAPTVLRLWADMLRQVAHTRSSLRKATEAEALADRMEAWHIRKVPD